VRGETAAIVRRAAAEGHGIGLHSHTRALLADPPDRLARRLSDHADAIAALAGVRPCALFRPHAGWRSGQMYAGLERAGLTLAGWSFGLWDWNWWRRPRPAALATRLARKISDGDIVVLHDGHHVDPRADRQRTIDATAALVPLLKARGMTFASLCDAVGPKVRAAVEPWDLGPSDLLERAIQLQRPS
jgi:peptidoglycan/xylan/chitin deacetylase (PgdA/CDA1 family)